MMDDVVAFLRLGWEHILDPAGADHLLFLVVLAAGYRMQDWRAALGVATAFTVGHSLSLALSVTDALRVPSELVEFLIPLTIAFAGVETLVAATAPARTGGARRRVLLVGLFGLVHGAGFANYLRSLFSDDVAAPLLGFNLGVELAQAVVLLACALLFTGFDRCLAAIPPGRPAPATFRVRAAAVSTAVTAAAVVMAAGRAPWA
jgi:hypothetical protein